VRGKGENGKEGKAGHKETARREPKRVEEWQPGASVKTSEVLGRPWSRRPADNVRALGQEPISTQIDEGICPKKRKVNHKKVFLGSMRRAQMLSASACQEVVASSNNRCRETQGRLEKVYQK